MAGAMYQRLVSLLRSLLQGAGHLLYPGCCLLCGDPLAAEQDHFCAACHRALFVDPHASCPRCAGTIGPFAVVDGCCHACKEESFTFERVVRLGQYGGLLRELILRLKKQRSEGLGELLGECWAREASERFAALSVDVLVPVPLHWLRRWQRGYNQSAALCRGMATHLNKPYQLSWLRRIRHTPLQSLRTPAERKANVRGAFRVRPGASLQGKSVLLVDDVMTTGATASEAAHTLRAGGAARVVVAVLARAQG